MARSRPMVVVRSPPEAAEQKDPAPWVGQTGVSSGSSISSCSEWCGARARGTVISGLTRSVRPQFPPSGSLREDAGKLAGVEQQVREVLR